METFRLEQPQGATVELGSALGILSASATT
jgi:hypothetical protein